MIKILDYQNSLNGTFLLKHFYVIFICGHFVYLILDFLIVNVFNQQVKLFTKDQPFIIK